VLRLYVDPPHSQAQDRLLGTHRGERAIRTSAGTSTGVVVAGVCGSASPGFREVLVKRVCAYWACVFHMHNGYVDASEHEVHVAGLSGRADAGQYSVTTATAAARPCAHASAGYTTHWVAGRRTTILRTVAHLHAF